MMARRDYMAVLLRLWRDRPDSSWRAIIENPHSGERIVFATAGDLIAYLEGVVGLIPDTDAPRRRPHELG